MEKELQVSAIKDGTVIDHIPPKLLFKIISILGIREIQSAVTIGNNFQSNRLGKKAIIKIENKFFVDEEINKIALILPHAKLNIIRDYQVVEKRVVELPETIEGFVKCINPKCITNHEEVATHFKVISKEPVALKCRYCEKITDSGNFVINK